ncbi:Shedu immune nuclease family protein [Paraburkholderia tropica]|uniref:Shedu immune nuclease family protein n=1 Tax=Paraburkholderia tropica TaxID=92647 RepID=UPI0016210CA5|nr:Shedu immune nuclease family protein [Paraburkholderia tropica]MBB2984660.1 hypothetical protein [Paraburkholderia tropica]
MRDETLIQQYITVLDSPAPPGRQKEQVVQDFLEEHSVLIPTPNRLNHHLHFQSIISKFPLSTGLITDYAYLTKSSDTWRITFVELESPDKDFFNKTTQKVSKSSTFNAALDQVRSWKQFMSSNEPEVRARLLPLIQPPNMRINPIEYEYQLIYGRSVNKNLTEGRKREFRSLQQDMGITIMTFDQLVDLYRNDLVFEKNVLRVVNAGFTFKSMAAGLNHMLSYLGPGELFLSPSEIAALKADGYDMDAWEQGKLLTVNGRLPLSASNTMFNALLSKQGGQT